MFNELGFGFERDWGYKASDREQLKAEIVADSHNCNNTGFLKSLDKPGVQLASIASSIAFPVVDVISYHAKIAWEITDLMNRTPLHGHNTLQGLTYTSMLLIGTSALIAKVDSLVAQIAQKYKINSSVDEFIKKEYKI